MGDPETETVLPRIKSDLLELFDAVGKEQLHGQTLEIDPRTTVTVMLVAGGYPGDYEKGMQIDGIDDVKESIVFHAGTKSGEEETVLTNGGRVLAITSYGNSILEASEKSFANAEKINYTGKYYRKDIGKDLIAYKG